MLQYLKVVPVFLGTGVRRVAGLFSHDTAARPGDGTVAWKSYAKAGAAVAILAAAAGIYAWRSGANESVNDRSDYDTRLHCRACGHEFTANLNVADEPPHPCAKCKQRAAWRARMCNDCGNVFCPEPEGDPPRQPMIPICPKCRSASTGAAPVENR